MADGIMVKVAPLGRTVNEVLIPSNSTVDAALKAAGVNPRNFDDLRKNGKTVSLGDICFGNDIITLVPNIRGGWEEDLN